MGFCARFLRAKGGLYARTDNYFARKSGGKTVYGACVLTPAQREDGRFTTEGVKLTLEAFTSGLYARGAFSHTGFDGQRQAAAHARRGCVPASL